MTDSFSFNGALSKPGTWSVGESQFDDGGKFLKISIPVDSIHEFCNHLMSMADDQSKHKTIKVWNYQQKKAEEVSGIVFTAKGQEGQYGAFGQINPKKIESIAEPF